MTYSGQDFLDIEKKLIALAAASPVPVQEEPDTLPVPWHEYAERRVTDLLEWYSTAVFEIRKDEAREEDRHLDRLVSLVVNNLGPIMESISAEDASKLKESVVALHYTYKYGE